MGEMNFNEMFLHFCNMNKQTRILPSNRPLFTSNQEVLGRAHFAYSPLNVEI
jgi:hypothetical protein